MKSNRNYEPIFIGDFFSNMIKKWGELWGYKNKKNRNRVQFLF